ncbi:DUF6183 family protein [Streptomyces gamaensis]|uniref:DUF6183 family protein n=1 Tax=Streptomyces gamaensis TaxID=1763542 RepID=A0ABW0YQX5_9ACTN
MADEIETIAANLPRLKDLSTVTENAARRLKRGNPAFAADLAIAVHRRYGSKADGKWQYRSLLDQLLRLLTTTPGRANLEQTLRLVALTDAGKSKRDSAYVASLLADAHAPRDLALVFTGGSSQARASEELRACLAHELLLRGVNVTAEPGMARWTNSPHWRYHPLGRLPLSLAAFEECPDLPSYSASGGSWSVPYGDATDGPQAVRKSASPHPTATETTTESAAKSISAAVSNWSMESNGQVEARTFALPEPLPPEAVPATLDSLPLDSFKAPSAGNRPALYRCSATAAWRQLFAAASQGGAYNEGLRGAYGRLAAWQSLAALSGVPEHASSEEIEQAALACDWYSFGAGTKWFYNVMWDIGLVAVTPDGRRLAVLAATDTD